MFLPAIADFFKYKLVGSIIVLACWSPVDEVQFVKQLSTYGLKVNFACDPKALEIVPDYGSHGVLYFGQDSAKLLEKVEKKYFSHWYKWLIISEDIPLALHRARYDCDVALLREYTEPSNDSFVGEVNGTSLTKKQSGSTIFFDDIYAHPREGASRHLWAYWKNPGLQVTHSWQRTLRLNNVRKYPFRIAAPVAHYAEGYDGTFLDYLADVTAPDAGLRAGFAASELLIEALNATQVLLPVKYWVVDFKNGTLDALKSEEAELGAGNLRILHRRMDFVDFVMAIWLFRTGFTYLAERQSSSNMYVEPFTAAVWWCCLAIGLTLAFAQRVASRQPQEKEGAYMSVLATWLQQDASAVPEGAAGRWTFTVMSVCSMLVHAYYTSAIVSALMSTGRGGPTTLRELADSRYTIASEDHDFVRDSLFEIKTNSEDLEYLKKKKMNPNFYQDLKYGVQLLQQGSTAFHAEYHQIYYHLSDFSDDDICKMQTVDTIPETMTYVTATVRGQWTDIIRSTANWLHETGLYRRVLHEIQMHPPPCRAAMLAERVTFWDVAPLLGLTTLGAIASVGLLGLENMVAKWAKREKAVVDAERKDSEATLIYIK